MFNFARSLYTSGQGGLPKFLISSIVFMLSLKSMHHRIGLRIKVTFLFLFPPEDLPDRGIKPRSVAFQADSLPSELDYEAVFP